MQYRDSKIIKYLQENVVISDVQDVPRLPTAWDKVKLRIGVLLRMRNAYRRSSRGDLRSSTGVILGPTPQQNFAILVALVNSFILVISILFM